MTRAVGVHAHPRLKLGLAPTDPDKVILSIDRVLTGITPPATEDRYKDVVFGMDGNDVFGTCGPTSVDNHRRSTAKVATEAQRSASLEEVYELYRESGNPNFDPKDGNTEDNGVEMGAMLDQLRAHGLGGDKPIATGRAKDMSDAAIERLVAVFGGVLFAVNLLEAQQEQTDASPPRWDYKKSGEWGGHAIYCGKYAPEGTGVDAPVISWAEEIETTSSFRVHQLEEVWVVIWPWHLEHPAFFEGVDVAALAAVYKEVTGKVLPLPEPRPEPTPEPKPTPPEAEVVTPADEALWTAIAPWAEAKHVRANKRAAKAAREWAEAKRLYLPYP